MRVVRMIAVLAAAACSNDPTAPLNRAFTVDVGQTVSVDDSELSIKFLRVTEDSRCPQGVLCIWAGNGQIEIEVRDEGQATKLVLNTMEGAKEVAVGSYRIQLVELAPIQTQGQPIPAGSYRATLKVSRTGIACTEEARPALMVGLVDSLTPSILTFTTVTIRATDGAYADSMVMPVYPADPYNGPVPLAYERRGTYTVSVSANGYATWTKAGVLVTGDQCHVATVPLTARLAH